MSLNPIAAPHRSESNVSFNDVLLVGPTAQGELFSILLRFRMPWFVFSADRQQMYRRIWIGDWATNWISWSISNTSLRFQRRWCSPLLSCDKGKNASSTIIETEINMGCCPSPGNIYWMQLVSGPIWALDNLVILRHVCLSDYTKLQLHVFPDESEDGYGAAHIFDRTVNLIKLPCDCCELSLELLQSKKLTIPRLELWEIFKGNIWQFVCGPIPRHPTTILLLQTASELYMKSALLANGGMLEARRILQMFYHV